MTRKKWLVLMILLLSGPTWFPLSLELIAVIEFLGILGIGSVYSSYAQYWCNHPSTKHYWRLATSWDFQPQTFLEPKLLGVNPQLLFHFIPVKSIMVWSAFLWLGMTLVAEYWSRL
ncbi:hypothetical protein [uncultured Shewanella sp.]|uniref:hypothetical protein n=1 Tax=uncultured Shewanella sp. TaxID=173975 RepID=UPI002618B929|nr:hypothetical protein [uncultured Shewanella sp.]